MSSKILDIKDTFLNAVHFLPNGTQWTGDVHYHSEDNPSPEGFVGFMTGKTYSKEGIELVTFPTLIEYPDEYSPATKDFFDLAFSDLQSSGLVGESEIGAISGALRQLGNTISMSRTKIESAVDQIIGAVNNSINQTEADGTGMIDDSFYEDVWTLEAEGVTDYRTAVESITYEHTGGDTYIFQGDAETLQENPTGWMSMLQNHITVDMISRINTLTFDEILTQIEDATEFNIPNEEFRYIPANIDQGFSGVLNINLDAPKKITHLKFLFSTFITFSV